jgi:hypothetical protein
MSSLLWVPRKPKVGLFLPCMDPTALKSNSCPIFLHVGHISDLSGTYGIIDCREHPAPERK